MARTIVATEKAPAAIGPYSQGIIADGKLLFTAGQIALDPDTGEMAPADIGLQTRQVLKNLSAVLEGGASSLQQVVKVTIYLLDMSDYDLVNEIYTEYFGESIPARALVQVSRLPKDALIEMECVALAGQ
jgi:2-iminobutanoate/2-iminopropanoate deaminase